LAKIREWSENEIEKLGILYTSDMSFEEILDEFPERTSNAIRLKASRLRLRRPTIPTSMIQSDKILRCKIKAVSSNILFKCNECGSWIQITDIENDIPNTLSCYNCGSIFQILTD
jgi:hypothetical protein